MLQIYPTMVCSSSDEEAKTLDQILKEDTALRELFFKKCSTFLFFLSVRDFKKLLPVADVTDLVFQQYV